MRGRVSQHDTIPGEFQCDGLVEPALGIISPVFDDQWRCSVCYNSEWAEAAVGHDRPGTRICPSTPSGAFYRQCAHKLHTCAISMAARPNCRWCREFFKKPGALYC